tara:strand:- start:496 stop:618 length:123 start_codon:yes stop_codon:yes gene_type:complete
MNDPAGILSNSDNIVTEELENNEIPNIVIRRPTIAILLFN